MICKGFLTDRKKLVKAIERETGLKASYAGAPGFNYNIGGHTVLRDGSLETKDKELVRKLAAEGLVEGRQVEEGISFSTEGFTGRTLVNLVNSIAAREKMLNKAVDHPNAFHMSVGLVRALKEANPSTVTDFMDVLYTQGGEKSMKGMRVSRTRVTFPGFPDTPVFHNLAEKMVDAASTQGWIRPKMKVPENEKYSFRVWLMAIGMKGPEYKEARAELLSRFEGDAAFRTEEQRKAWEKKKKKSEPDFILL